MLNQPEIKIKIIEYELKQIEKNRPLSNSKNSHLSQRIRVIKQQKSH